MTIAKKIEIENETLLKELAHFSLEETFYVIWAIGNNLQFNIPIPTDIETSKDFDSKSDKQLRRLKFIPEWELEFLLLYATVKNTRLNSPYSLKNFTNLGHIINRIRNLDNLIVRNNLGPTIIITKELFRIAHRQFKWQETIDIHFLYRYYKIFSHPSISSLLKKEFSLDARELLLTGLVVLNGFHKAPITILPVESSIPYITEKMISTFFDHFSFDLNERNKLTKNLPALNEQLFYNFSPLQKYPIIISENRAFCPITTYLIWRITNGLYYDLVNKKGFDQPFGESFQSYTGIVLNKTLTNNYKIHPEVVYSKPEKRSSDWIVIKDDVTVFIECKTKRLKLGSKTQLIKEDDILDDINLMAKFILQGYKSINDALNNCLPELSITDRSSTFLVIVTLEDWFIQLYPDSELLLSNKIKSLMQSSKIELNIIDEIPYYILSIDQIEKHFQVINKIGFKEYSSRYSKSTLSEITQDFKYEQLFLTEFEDLFHI
jgi:hypothetical protein